MKASSFKRLENKYGVETKPSFPLPSVVFSLPEMANLEASIRNQLDTLWNLPNKSFNILRACADSGAAKAQNPNEEKAVAGYKFCHKLLNIIDYLKANRNTVSLSEIKKGLETILELIQENLQHTEEEKQFPNVSELIFQLMPHSKKYDRKIRDQEYAKARKGLSRIASVSLTILNQMNKLGGKSEVSGRFDPQGAKLSEAEIMSFIRQYGDNYNIPDLSAWSLILDTAPELELPLTKLVHSLSRGHIPESGSRLKLIIKNILNKHQERLQNNQTALQEEKPGPNPLVLFEEENEAWDQKMANKYYNIKEQL